jgi:dipeptidyl aminopeptidase/acylaminoacyl peptidase
MSARDGLDRQLADWMTGTTSGPAPTGRFEQAMAATARHRPRSRWLARFGSDWVGTTARRVEWASPSVRQELLLAATMALLVAAAIIGALLMGGFLRPDPANWRLGGLTYSVDGDIYVTAADGKPPVRIADGVPDSDGNIATSFWDPHYSPDGRYLMYHDNWGSVQVTDPQGRPVSFFQGWYSTWSPDSSRIATWLGSSGDKVGVVTPDGRLVASLVIPIQLQGCCGDQRAGWSLDGKNIVLPKSVMLFPVDGSAPRLPSVEEAKAHHVPAGPYSNPVWSATGDRIAVTSWQGGTAPKSIQVVNVASGIAVTVHTAPADDQLTALAWSPDEQAVLVVQGNGSPGGASVWSVPVDGSGGHVVVERADQEGADWRWVAQGNH